MSYAEAVAQATGPGQMFELVPYTVNGVTYKIFKNAPPSLREFFAFGADARRRAVPRLRGRAAELRRAMAQVDAFAATLWSTTTASRRATGSPSRMRNYPEWVIAFAAITSIGAVAVSLNAWWTEDELDYGLEDSGATVLIADQERAERAAASCERSASASSSCVTRTAAGPGADRLDDVVVPGDAAARRRRSTPTTTPRSSTRRAPPGDPKGAVSTHRAVVHALHGLRAAAADDRRALRRARATSVTHPHRDRRSS